MKIVSQNLENLFEKYYYISQKNTPKITHEKLNFWKTQLYLSQKLSFRINLTLDLDFAILVEP